MDTPVSGHPEGSSRDPRHWDDRLLQQALDGAGESAWGPIAVIPSTGSTNADAAEQAREGAPEGFTVVADEQTQGRGRLDRSWESPSGAGLAMSVVLRPVAPTATWGWIPLLAGVAVVDALRGRGVDATVKWPNDVVVDGPAHDGSPGPRKLGGLLVERIADTTAVVVGVGINTDLGLDELPVARATSTRLEGHDLAREELVVDILERMRSHWVRWQLASGDAERSGLAAAYAVCSSTLGRDIRALLPGGEVLEGRARAVDGDGRLVIGLADGTARVVSAGDVEHLR